MRFLSNQYAKRFVKMFNIITVVDSGADGFEAVVGRKNDDDDHVVVARKSGTGRTDCDLTTLLPKLARFYHDTFLVQPWEKADSN